jgi:hypothetical protein
MHCNVVLLLASRQNNAPTGKPECHKKQVCSGQSLSRPQVVYASSSLLCFHRRARHCVFIHFSPRALGQEGAQRNPPSRFDPAPRPQLNLGDHCNTLSGTTNPVAFNISYTRSASPFNYCLRKGVIIPCISFGSSESTRQLSRRGHASWLPAATRVPLSTCPRGSRLRRHISALTFSSRNPSSHDSRKASTSRKRRSQTLIDLYLIELARRLPSASPVP